MSIFVISDERHGEPFGKFGSRREAIAELERLASIPWDQEPNCPPCTNWRNCRRLYELIEYDDSASPWKPLSSTLMLEISAAGVQWSPPDD